MVRPVVESDLAEADWTFRAAFGAFMGELAALADVLQRAEMFVAARFEV